MAWCEPEIVCMKHPDHKQQPGVCSCCLRERLSKISGPTMVVSSSYFSSPSNASSPANYSSASSSTQMSPSHRGHHRTTSDVLNSFSFIANGTSGLRKTRSIAFAARGRVRDGVHGKKKEGFWSKLLRSSRKKTKETFTHPRMKERFVY